MSSVIDTSSAELLMQAIMTADVVSKHRKFSSQNVQFQERWSFLIGWNMLNQGQQNSATHVVPWPLKDMYS